MSHWVRQQRRANRFDDYKMDIAAGQPIYRGAFFADLSDLYKQGVLRTVMVAEVALAEGQKARVLLP